MMSQLRYLNTHPEKEITKQSLSRRVIILIVGTSTNQDSSYDSKCLK